MAESSRFFNSNGVGDGGASGYTRAQIASWMKAVFGAGILKGIGSELVVSGTASPLSVATGAAIVDGLFYENSAALNKTVTTPSEGTTGGRIVLRADWAAQTVRAVVVLNTDGVADPPALTQTSGTTYEINLATFTITTGGEIGSLVVEPDRASFGSGLQYGDMTLSGWGILGNAGNTVDEAERIIPSGDGLPLNRNGTALEFGQIGTSGIADWSGRYRTDRRRRGRRQQDRRARPSVG